MLCSSKLRTMPNSTHVDTTRTKLGESEASFVLQQLLQESWMVGGMCDLWTVSSCNFSIVLYNYHYLSALSLSSTFLYLFIYFLKSWFIIISLNLHYLLLSSFYFHHIFSNYVAYIFNIFFVFSIRIIKWCERK